VTTKEEADHSLPYLVAAALIDREMTPAQYSEERLRGADVQALLQRVEVHSDPALSAAFPEHQGVRVEVLLRDGGTRSLAKPDYEGPSSWEALEAKYRSLGGPAATIDVVKRLDEVPVAELAAVL